MGPAWKRHKTTVELELNRKIVVNQFAPRAFRNIREMDNINDAQVITSLDPALNIKSI